MLLIFDTCNISVAKEPSGGFILKLTGIEGFPGIDVLVPIEGKEQAGKVHSAIGDIISTIPTFTSVDLKGATSAPPTNPS